MIMDSAIVTSYLWLTITEGLISPNLVAMVVVTILSLFRIYIWTASSEFGTYRLCEQRRFRWACASAQSRQNLCYSLIQAVNQEEPSDRKPDPWPLWMVGHAQLKFVMTECSKTQIRLTGLNYGFDGSLSSFRMLTTFCKSISLAKMLVTDQYYVKRYSSNYVLFFFHFKVTWNYVFYVTKYFVQNIVSRFTGYTITIWTCHGKILTLKFIAFEAKWLNKLRVLIILGKRQFAQCFSHTKQFNAR